MFSVIFRFKRLIIDGFLGLVYKWGDKKRNFSLIYKALIKKIFSFIYKQFNRKKIFSLADKKAIKNRDSSLAFKRLDIRGGGMINRFFGGMILAFMPIFCFSQSINISNFNYRDFLDFGQNKGVFGLGNNSLNASNPFSDTSQALGGAQNIQINGKDSNITLPNTPFISFSASSNFGSLAHLQNGFAVSANHVKSPLEIAELRKWGLSTYNIANYDGSGISGIYGNDTRFMRLDRYVVEGNSDMLESNFTNTLDDSNKAQQNQNIESFKTLLNNFKDAQGNVYLYGSGSGVIRLGDNNTKLSINNNDSGEQRGGFFGSLPFSSVIYATSICNNNSTSGCQTSGVRFNIKADSNFQNISTSGDSGSAIYAFDSKNNKWVLLGVLSQSFEHLGLDESQYSFVSNKDFKEFSDKFMQNITIGANGFEMSQQELAGYLNKDLVFSGGGNINVTSNINRLQSGTAGGFIFLDSNNATTYKFSGQNNANYSFKGSGLNIGKNVVIEWNLHNETNDTLHKIGEGTLIVKHNFAPKDSNPNYNLGYLKIGQGKVILDSNTKSYEGIYLTSGRGSLELVANKAQALGAVRDNNKGYILEQNSTNNMGIYFGSGGGVLELSGNSLTLNTIAANDSNAVILNTATAKSRLEIQGFSYDSNGLKTNTKGDTLIHASIGKLPIRDNAGNITNTNATNIDIIYNGDSNATLIFDGNINTSGELQANNANITLQGHATTHAIISDENIRNQVINAHKQAGNALSSDIDLSKPSTLTQSDYDEREFNFGNGIKLSNSHLSIGRNSVVNGDISLDSTSKVTFGSAVKHFIDNKDGANINGSGFGYYQRLESGIINNLGIDTTISYKGTIRANGGIIESKISYFNASLNLSNNALLNAKYFTLDSTNNVTFNNAKGVIENLHFKGINNLNNKFNLTNNSTLEITKTLTFEDASINLDSIESALQNAGAKVANYDIYASKSNITANSLNSNMFLSSGTILNASMATLSGEKSNIILQDSNTNLKITESINANTLESSYIIATNNATLNSKSLNFNNVKASNIIANKDSNISITDTLSLKNSNLNISLRDNASIKSNEISLQDSKNNAISLSDNAKIESKSLTLSNSTLNLDSKNISINTINLSKNSTLNYNADSKNLDSITLDNSRLNIQTNTDFNKLNNITLSNNSSLAMNELSYNTQQISTDSNSMIYLNTLNFSQNQNTKELNANINISNTLNLNDVGIAQNAMDNRYNTLKFTQDLNLESNTKINVNFHSSVLNDNSGNIELGKFYTLLSVKNLSDNRSDKKINFSFTDSNKAFFMVSKVEGNSIFIKFLQDNPKAFSEVNKRIDSKYSDIARILIEHNSDDKVLDNAVSTDNYNTLNEYLAKIDSNLNSLAKSDLRKLNSNILFGNNHSINMRVSHVRFAQNLPRFYNFNALKLAYNETNTEYISDVIEPNPLKDSLDSIESNEIESSPKDSNKIATKYRPIILSNTNAANNAWGSISAGYFGGESSMGFYSMNAGYDRLINDVLIGIMAGYGNSIASLNALKDSSHLLNAALYAHAPINNHEIASNLNTTTIFSRKTMSEDFANSINFGILWNTYYKYAFNIESNSTTQQSIKPIALFGIGLNHIGEMQGATYKMQPYSDFSLDLGLGAEYVLQKKHIFLSLQFLVRQPLLHTKDSISLSLTNANSYLTYKLRGDTTSFELGINAAHSLAERVYMQYSVIGLVDIRANFAIKGDLKFGFLF